MSKSSTPLRAAVIGLGVGGAHLRGYQGAGVEISAICDANLERLAEVGEKYSIPTDQRFSDYESMLAEVKPDLVSVALPNAMHAPVSIKALEAGAHVLCEKPMAMNTAEAQQMIQVAQKSQRRLMICYNHRYRADLAWIRRMLEAGALGDIYHIEAHWRRETGIPGWGWFGSREASGGGSLIDLGVHVLDMALWLLDYPGVSSVSGSTRSAFGVRGQKVWGLPRWMSDKSVPFDVEDGGIGFIRLKNGASLHLEATWAEHRAPKDDLIRLEIQGTEATAILNIPNYTKDNTLTLYTAMAGAPVTVTPIVRWDGTWGHEGLIADVAEAIRTGNPSPTPAEQGLLGVQIIEAIYASAHSGREVVFD